MLAAANRQSRSRQLRRVIDLIQQNAKGAELGPVLETIENALRADQAKMTRRNEQGRRTCWSRAADGPCRPLLSAGRDRPDSTGVCQRGFY